MIGVISPDFSRGVILEERCKRFIDKQRPKAYIPALSGGNAALSTNPKRRINMSYSASDIRRSDSFVEIGYGVDCPPKGASPSDYKLDPKTKKCVFIGKKKK